MTIKQERKLSMELALRDFLLQNATITTTLPSFATYFTPFQANVTAIQSIRIQQEIDKTGITASKKTLRDDLIVKAVDIIRKVTAYAKVTNNAQLIKEIGYSESALKKSADTILRDICQVVYDKTNANIAALSTYGIVAATLTAFQTAITNYNVAIPKPRLGQLEKQQATTQLDQLFKLNDDLLGKIDALVEIVRLTQVIFYNNYQNVRKVIETGTSSLALQAKVVDKNTLEPLSNVLFKFKLVNSETLKSASTNGNGEIEKKSADKGMFKIKSMPEGEYKAVVSRPGYKSQELNVTVVNGEMTELDVEMEKS
jgi:hypothetical protein